MFWFRYQGVFGKQYNSHETVVDEVRIEMEFFSGFRAFERTMLSANCLWLNSCAISQHEHFSPGPWDPPRDT